MINLYEGIPLFIGTGTKIDKKDYPKITSAVIERLRFMPLWRSRNEKGIELLKAMQDEEEGSIKNIQLTRAFNAYKAFLKQSFASVEQSFRVTTDKTTTDVERPQKILGGYLKAINQDIGKITNDLITYGSCGILLDVAIEKEELPSILVNRIPQGKICYDFENKGACVFSVYLTPEELFKLDFIDQNLRNNVYGTSLRARLNTRSSENSETYKAIELRCFVGELVVNSKLDSYIAFIANGQVIYAERKRELTVARCESFNEKNTDFSPIFSVLKSAQFSQDTFKIIMDFIDETANPVITTSSERDAQAIAQAKRTKLLKLSQTALSQLGKLPEGQLDITSLTGLQQYIENLSRDSVGLNDYTLGNTQGTVRTLGEAMMLADSATGVLNEVADCFKVKVLLPVLKDILEILKEITKELFDIFPSELDIDLDLVKDSREAQIILQLTSSPMFSALINNLKPEQTIMFIRWMFQKMHIAGTSDLFDQVLNNIFNKQGQQQ